MTRGLLLALLSKEHVVLIGPPGTAKTMIAMSLANSIKGLNVFSYLLTKFTEYSELFGAVDINELMQGRYVRRWSPIVNSHVVFLDEVFKANSAILNSLLSLMNERVIYDPATGAVIKTPLMTVIGASNETPDEELSAFYSRFLVKVFVNYLSDQSLFMRALRAVWLNGGQNSTPVLSIDDVIAAQAQVEPG